MVRNKNKLIRYLNKKAQICYLQILILIISIIAFNFLIQDSTSSNSLKTDSQSETGKLTTILGFIFQKIKQPILPMVSAEDSLAGWACCEKNNNGNFCTFQPEEECNTNFKISPTQCENTDFCNLGCCIGDSGICSINTPKTNCNGAWFENKDCNIQECKRGCCILGDESKFITEKECRVKAGELGISVNFKNDINSEVECLYLTEKQVQGACISGEGNCLYTSLEQCNIKKGEFHNTFCSNPALNTSCIKHDRTGCLEGKEEVYWFDSCGNREEVKEGCNIFLGSVCGQYRPGIDKEPDEGDYVCRDLSCNVEINGKIVNKKNGEAWCEYEGCIGNGKDPVGSRHIRHICSLGEEKIEPCDDFRNQICVQSDTKLADGSYFSEAACRVNRWRSCYEYNTGIENMNEKCLENPDCIVKSVDIENDEEYKDAAFSFDVCMPNYPPGFQFWRTDDSSRNGELESSFATQTCPVVYVKRISGFEIKWICEANCDCEKAGFAQQMNDLCISLGDCGSYINWAGDYTDDGYSSGKAGRIDGRQYEYCAENQPNQNPASPGDFEFSQILGIPEGLSEDDIPKVDSTFGIVGAGITAISMTKYFTVTQSAATIAGTWTSLYEAGPNQISSEAFRRVTNEYIGNFGPEAFTKGGGIKLPSLGDSLAAAGAALSVANFMQAAFGIDEDTSYIVGGSVGLLMILNVINIHPIFFVILTILQWVGGLGETKIKYVTFNCLPWQPPTGGLNCDLCNTNDPLGVPCSEYRCKSLGQTCELINPRTENAKCINNNPNDVSSPKIKPLYNITSGFEYKNVNENGFEIKTINNDCIPEYTILNFGIETDKPARCRIGTDFTQDYDKMPEFFGGKNYFLIEHYMQLAVPSPSAFKNRYNLADEETEEIGQIDYFVKCENVNGISNTAPFSIKTCVKPGPDLSPPKITKTIPEIGYLAYGETEKEMQFYTNEPSQCRWSAEDKDYDNMENTMSCLTGIEDYRLSGWPCFANIQVPVSYIRCKDQPWLPEENQSRNKMTESYNYNLQISENPLIIEDFRPENGKEILSGIEPVIFDFKIKTSGGIDGTSTCRWEGNRYSDDFPELNSNFHSYTITSGTRGTYNIKFTCEDKAGNIAENSTSFSIKIDSKGPRITRVFNEGGLKIITDEDSECRYSFSNFIWENATEMVGIGIEHTSEWQLKTYFIQCIDDYGNKGGKITVRPYN